MSFACSDALGGWGMKRTSDRIAGRLRAPGSNRRVPAVLMRVRAFAAVGPLLVLALAARGRADAPSLLFASDAAEGDKFGSDVAIHGSTAVIGAPLGGHAGGPQAGSAYVFVRHGTAWLEEAKLMAADAAEDDRFGCSVAIDGNTLVVGACSDDHAGGVASGSAYVFVRQGLAWVQEAKLVADDAGSTDGFGWSVAVSGDRIAVGAPSKDGSGPTSSGAVYVFVRSGSSWSQEAKLTASDAQNEHVLGYDVAMQGDMIVAGAPGDESHGNYSGAAYVFVRAGLSWVQSAKLTASDAAEEDSLGWSVSLSRNAVLLGAPNDDHSGLLDAGSAYLFDRAGSSWTERARLVAGDAKSHAYFGLTVGLTPRRAVAGAPYDDGGVAPWAGAAYVFGRAGGAWTPRAKLVATEANALDQFGSAVTLAGAVVIVGAPGDDHAGGLDAGSATAFRRLHP